MGLADILKPIQIPIPEKPITDTDFNFIDKTDADTAIL